MRDYKGAVSLPLSPCGSRGGGGEEERTHPYHSSHRKQSTASSRCSLSSSPSLLLLSSSSPHPLPVSSSFTSAGYRHPSLDSHSLREDTLSSDRKMATSLMSLLDDGGVASPAQLFPGMKAVKPSLKEASRVMNRQSRLSRSSKDSPSHVDADVRRHSSPIPRRLSEEEKRGDLPRDISHSPSTCSSLDKRNSSVSSSYSTDGLHVSMWTRKTSHGLSSSHPCVVSEEDEEDGDKREIEKCMRREEETEVLIRQSDQFSAMDIFEEHGEDKDNHVWATTRHFAGVCTPQDHNSRSRSRWSLASSEVTIRLRKEKVREEGRNDRDLSISHSRMSSSQSEVFSGVKEREKERENKPEEPHLSDLSSSFLSSRSDQQSLRRKVHGGEKSSWMTRALLRKSPSVSRSSSFSLFSSSSSSRLSGNDRTSSSSLSSRQAASSQIATSNTASWSSSFSWRDEELGSLGEEKRGTKKEKRRRGRTEEESYHERSSSPSSPSSIPKHMTGAGSDDVNAKVDISLSHGEMKNRERNMLTKKKNKKKLATNSLSREILLDSSGDFDTSACSHVESSLSSSSSSSPPHRRCSSCSSVSSSSSCVSLSHQPEISRFPGKSSASLSLSSLSHPRHSSSCSSPSKEDSSVSLCLQKSIIYPSSSSSSSSRSNTSHVASFSSLSLRHRPLVSSHTCPSASTVPPSSSLSSSSPRRISSSSSFSSSSSSRLTSSSYAVSIVSSDPEHLHTRDESSRASSKASLLQSSSSSCSLSSASLSLPPPLVFSSALAHASSLPLDHSSLAGLDDQPQHRDEEAEENEEEEEEGLGLVLPPSPATLRAQEEEQRRRRKSSLHEKKSLSLSTSHQRKSKDEEEEVVEGEKTSNRRRTGSSLQGGRRFSLLSSVGRKSQKGGKERMMKGEDLEPSSSALPQRISLSEEPRVNRNPFEEEEEEEEERDEEEEDRKDGGGNQVEDHKKGLKKMRNKGGGGGLDHHEKKEKKERQSSSAGFSSATTFPQESGEEEGARRRTASRRLRSLVSLGRGGGGGEKSQRRGKSDESSQVSSPSASSSSPVVPSTKASGGVTSMPSVVVHPPGTSRGEEEGERSREEQKKDEEEEKPSRGRKKSFLSLGSSSSRNSFSATGSRGLSFKGRKDKKEVKEKGKGEDDDDDNFFFLAGNSLTNFSSSERFSSISGGLKQNSSMNTGKMSSQSSRPKQVVSSLRGDSLEEEEAREEEEGEERTSVEEREKDKKVIRPVLKPSQGPKSSSLREAHKGGGGGVHTPDEGDHEGDSPDGLRRKSLSSRSTGQGGEREGRSRSIAFLDETLPTATTDPETSPYEGDNQGDISSSSSSPSPKRKERDRDEQEEQEEDKGRGKGGDVDRRRSTVRWVFDLQKPDEGSLTSLSKQKNHPVASRSDREGYAHDKNTEKGIYFSSSSSPPLHLKDETLPDQHDETGHLLLPRHLGDLKKPSSGAFSSSTPAGHLSDRDRLFSSSSSARRKSTTTPMTIRAEESQEEEEDFHPPGPPRKEEKEGTRLRMKSRQKIPLPSSSSSACTTSIVGREDERRNAPSKIGTRILPKRTSPSSPHDQSRSCESPLLDEIPSSPSYMVIHEAKNLQELLELPPAEYFNLKIEVERQRSILPRRWSVETLLVYQNLLLFCSSLKPLCVRVLIPLSSIQSVVGLDENLTEKGRRKAEKRGWRVKLLYTQDVDTSSRFHLGGGSRPSSGKKSTSVLLKTQDVIFRFKVQKDMDAWIQRLTLLSSKWRLRPSVPDFVYRPPCEDQLAEVSRDVRAGALNVLCYRISYIFYTNLRTAFRLLLFRGRLHSLEKSTENTIEETKREASIVVRASRQREAIQCLSLYLQKKIYGYFYDLYYQSKRLELYTEQKRNLKTTVMLLEQQEESVASHIVDWRRKCLTNVLTSVKSDWSPQLSIGFEPTPSSSNNSKTSNTNRRIY
ncbi:hypothetical protein CSUI_006722, partial [Cystoisospora suis]